LRLGSQRTPKFMKLCNFVFQDMPLPRILAILGAAENGSEHPLANAIVGFVKQSLDIDAITAKVSNFQTVPGCGLSVTISNVDEMELKGAQSSEMTKFYNGLNLNAQQQLGINLPELVFF
jgi:Cu+-exporting ATPase